MNMFLNMIKKIKTNILTRFLFYVVILSFIFLFILFPMRNIFAKEQGSGSQSQNSTQNSIDLQKQIQEKNSELNYIKNQIRDTQLKLQSTQTEKQTLSSQLRRINNSILQIDLGIKSSQITIEKLDLEIKSLKKNISSAEKLAQEKQATLGDILRKIQEKDNESVLYIMIKNKVLSDSILEIQSLRDIYDNLVIKINELRVAKEKLNTVLEKKKRLKNNKIVEIDNLKNKKIISESAKKEKDKFLKITKNKETNYKKYIEDLKKKQSEILQEIFDIETKLTKGINYKNLPKKLPGLLSLPIDKGNYTITQWYGITKYSRKFYRSGFHNGVDMAAPIGTPIKAVADGIVVSVGNQDKYCWKGAYGKYVAIRHYMGLTTLYAHMSLYKVKQGDTIKKGQIIGYVGDTGFATGPHLHFGIYDTSTFEIGPSRVCGPMPYGGHINPKNYIIF